MAPPPRAHRFLPRAHILLHGLRFHIRARESAKQLAPSFSARDGSSYTNPVYKWRCVLPGSVWLLMYLQVPRLRRSRNRLRRRKYHVKRRKRRRMSLRSHGGVSELACPTRPGVRGGLRDMCTPVCVGIATIIYKLQSESQIST